METSILDQGITLIFVGMGTVFVFLTVLVISMSMMSAIVIRFAPLSAEADASEEEIAAISAAIAQHRKNTRT